MEYNSSNSPVLLSLGDTAPGPGILIKDTVDIRGLPTRAGSRALAATAPAVHDAEVVALLRAAGWRIAGKSKLHELAFGTTGINEHDGTPLNPHWPELVPGGSSSGSAAAVAAGLVPAALGTDTGGSIRTPAACCGVFGLKPTFGLVSRTGVTPSVSSLDCVGPFSKDMSTLISVMQAIAPGFSALDAPAQLRVGVLEVDSVPQIRSTVNECLNSWERATRATQFVPAISKLFDDAYQAGLIVINAESWKAFGHLLDGGLVGHDVAQRLRKASATTAQQVADAREVGSRFTAEIDQLLTTCDVLALPAMSDFPPRLANAADTLAAVTMTRLVRPFNLSGHPAITVPVALKSAGPISLQLVAARGADAYLCAVAASLVDALRLQSSAQFFLES